MENDKNKPSFLDEVKDVFSVDESKQILMQRFEAELEKEMMVWAQEFIDEIKSAALEKAKKGEYELLAEGKKIEGGKALDSHEVKSDIFTKIIIEMEKKGLLQRYPAFKFFTQTERPLDKPDKCTLYLRDTLEIEYPKTTTREVEFFFFWKRKELVVGTFRHRFLGKYGLSLVTNILHLAQEEGVSVTFYDKKLLLEPAPENGKCLERSPSPLWCDWEIAV